MGVNRDTKNKSQERMIKLTIIQIRHKPKIKPEIYIENQYENHIKTGKNPKAFFNFRHIRKA